MSVESYAVDPIEECVTKLIESGKARGYLTWEELNESLPDEAVSPEKLEAVLNRIEQNNLKMIDEIEAAKLRSACRTRDRSISAAVAINPGPIGIPATTTCSTTCISSDVSDNDNSRAPS